MLSLVTKNILTFARLPYSICSGYKIYSIEVVDSVEVTHLIETVENNKAPNIILEKATLKCNPKKRWELSKHILALDSYSINVFINNIQISTNNYTYIPGINILSIHSNISANDLIEIEYNVDKMKVEYAAINNTSYKVVPIFNESHKIGQHTVL